MNILKKIQSDARVGDKRRAHRHKGIPLPRTEELLAARSPTHTPKTQQPPSERISAGVRAAGRATRRQKEATAKFRGVKPKPKIRRTLQSHRLTLPPSVELQPKKSGMDWWCEADRPEECMGGSTRERSRKRTGKRDRIQCLHSRLLKSYWVTVKRNCQVSV